MRGAVTPSAAGAQVHRRNELKARREHGAPRDPHDGDVAVLERLAQRFERGALELGQLVEKEDAVVGQARPLPAAASRPRRRSTAATEAEW